MLHWTLLKLTQRLNTATGQLIFFRLTCYNFRTILKSGYYSHKRLGFNTHTNTLKITIRHVKLNRPWTANSGYCTRPKARGPARDRACAVFSDGTSGQMHLNAFPVFLSELRPAALERKWSLLNPEENCSGVVGLGQLAETKPSNAAWLDHVPVCSWACGDVRATTSNQLHYSPFPLKLPRII